MKAVLRCVVLALPDASLLDLLALHEVFAVATRLARQSHSRARVGQPGSDQQTFSARSQVELGDSYQIEVIGAGVLDDARVDGQALTVARLFASTRGPIDTFLVVGGGPLGVAAGLASAELLAEVRALALRARRIGAVGAGELVLAAAGLLDDMDGATHWVRYDPLLAVPVASHDPTCSVRERAGSVYLATGVSAGLDLALALVRKDRGLTLACQVVHCLARPDGAARGAQTRARPCFAELQRYIADNLQADLRVPALAARAGMSRRTFARKFVDQLGITPAKYVERARIEAARGALEGGGLAVVQIARGVGLRTSRRLRHALRRAAAVPAPAPGADPDPCRRERRSAERSQPASPA